MDQKWGCAPSLEEFSTMAQDALSTFPEPFRHLAQRVSIRVSDFADEETLEALSIKDPYELTGLYSGVAMTLDLVSAPSTYPAVIWLYRLPILNEWAQRGDVALDHLVFHVLVHELGHHFGWSDDEMDTVLADDDS